MASPYSEKAISMSNLNFFLQDANTSHSNNKLLNLTSRTSALNSRAISIMSDTTSVGLPESSRLACQQRLYIINRSGTGEAQYFLLNQKRNAIESYGVRMETWRVCKGIQNFGVAVVDNVLYIIGGYEIKTCRHLHRVVKYDPYDFTWTECRPLMKARSKFAVCVYDGKIFVSGGERSDGQPSCSCEVYDPGSDVWSEAGLMVAPRKNHNCAISGSDMYLAGGDLGLRCHENLWVYENNNWEELDKDCPCKMPRSLDRYAMCSVGNKLYFVGGVSCKVSAENEVRFTTERGIFAYSTSINTQRLSRSHGLQHDVISPWSTRYPSMVRPRHSCAAHAIGTKIYVFGGCHLDTGQDVRVCECFDTVKGKWEDEFNFRKGDLTNVVTAVLEVPRRHDEQKVNYKLKWVLW